MPERGQPRRGRQGVLLLPRQHADALVHEVALQVPAARVPLRAARRGEPAARRAGARSSSCSTPGIFDDDRYFDVFVEYAKASARGPRDPRSGVSNRGPDDGAAARPAAPLVPQHLGLGRRGRAPSPIVRAGTPGPGFLTPRGRRPHRASRSRNLPVRATGWARATSTCDDGGRLLFTDNETNAPRVCGPGAQEPPAVRQGRLPPPRRSTARTAVNPDEVGTKACGALSATWCRRAARVTLRLRLTPDRLEAPLADVDADRRRAQGRGRRVLRGHPARRSATADEKLRPAAGLRRPALDEADLPLRREPLAGGRQPAAGRRRESRTRDPQRALAAPQLDARPVDAGQVGVPVVRRLGPGLPLRRRSPSSTRSSPRSSSGCCSSSSSSIPTGQIPAYEWEFSDLNPPVHAWAVWRVYNMDRIRTGKADRDFLEKLLPQAAHQLRLVDQQGRPRGQQRLRGRLPRPRQHHRRRPQRAACPTAPCSSSPTPPAGWACSA